ncbi:transposase [Megasphaera sp. BL7]|uniref:transposase n=1 Tax=Megasphaera sp. BL7 TaxID=1285585 RepID=UPI001EF9FE44|nr:transposase [Megasphaera sp. BL7]
MPRKKYTSEFKTKIVLSILQGDKEFNVICSENGLNPNMVRKWKARIPAKCPSCLWCRF